MPSDDRNRFSYDELAFEPFVNSSQVDAFYCGDEELDEFLNTQEVAQYQSERLGRTTLVYSRGELVAFYTLATDSLKVEFLKTAKGFGDHEYQLRVYPALLLGRLGVRKDLHGQGLGRLLVEHILVYAMNLAEEGVACRLVVLHATPSSIDFYAKCGFVLSSAHANKNRENKVMFFDLGAVDQHYRYGDE